jgi:hypothetical protein
MTSKTHLLLVALSLSLIAAGCQQTTQQATTLPRPKFTGPTVYQPTQSAPSNPSVAAASKRYTPAGVPADWIPNANAAYRKWDYIVIHHSASATGSIAIIDREHKEKGWDGIGYHFLVGNGHGMSDGEIDPTPRWPIQKWGAHTKTPDNRFNEHGIGICMVGNFDLTQPSQAQVKSVAKLVAYLMKTYNISPANVYGHGQCKPTDCPGKYTSVARIKQLATQMLADSGQNVGWDPSVAQITPNTPSNTAELLRDSQ